MTVVQEDPQPGSAPAAGAVAQGLPWLVADIGGTHARFGFMPAAEGPITEVATLRVADHAGPLEAAQDYLAAVQVRLGERYEHPRAAALAVATAVTADQVELTNAGWDFSQAALARSLGLERLRVLNDFEALALALPRLGGDQVRRVGEAAFDQKSKRTLAVIGPGTGLGVAGLIPTSGGWVALAGEGGHATLAPGDDAESDLLAVVRRRFAHVSAERLLSGIGLPVLHAAVAEMAGQAVQALDARAIVERGLQPDADPLCARTLDHFCALLGSFAGSVALTLGARGGVFVGGGIVPRLGERFLGSAFRERFEAKGRFRRYLEEVPTGVIVDTLAALGGAAQALRDAGASAAAASDAPARG